MDLITSTRANATEVIQAQNGAKAYINGNTVLVDDPMGGTILESDNIGRFITNFLDKNP